MNTCLCGDAVEAGSARCPRCAALHRLDLDFNASETEIRRSYRLLVKVWHPDRFQTDQKLKDAAEQKLKDINSAFEFLTSTSTERGPWRPPSRPPAEAARHQTPPSPDPVPVQSPAGNATAAGRPRRSLRSWPAFRFFLKTAVLLFVLLLGRYLWIAFDVPVPQDPEVAKVLSDGKTNLLRSLEAPKERFINAVEQDMRRLGLHRSASAPPAAPLIPRPAAPPANSLRLAKTPPVPRAIQSYITVGSTRDEVLAQQGTPAASSEDKLVYGKSELDFKDGVVIGWRIDPASPIRVKLWPSSAVDPSLASYTVGSSKDVVLTVQGTPTAFTEDKFEYGRSEVYFRDNRVVSWKEDPDSAPLWAR
jgi:hypothetical protein